jgi:hypothetical protein
MTPDQTLIAAAISSWQQVVMPVGALCLSLTEEQLLAEVGPGKNRMLYLWGHLTAIHDAMFMATFRLKNSNRTRRETDWPCS